MSGDNKKLKILGFLPIMVAQRVSQHRIVTNEVSRQFGSQKILPGIRTDIKLAEAFANGKPIRHYAPRSRGAYDFALVANAITDLLSSDL